MCALRDGLDGSVENMPEEIKNASGKKNMHGERGTAVYCFKNPKFIQLPRPFIRRNNRVRNLFNMYFAIFWRSRILEFRSCHLGTNLNSILLHLTCPSTYSCTRKLQILYARTEPSSCHCSKLPVRRTGDVVLLFFIVLSMSAKK